MIMLASYCRVSTDKDDQANSFESQRRYFREYIARQPDWELYKVYADEGITGTSTKKRVQFNQMIHDAHKGKFKLIITKEVSRFSRNILDTIAFTRELKALGVGVLFMNDGINTLDPDSELCLSIMGSIAQEESRKTSARVKWGQTRQMERGVVFGKSMLGYDVKVGCNVGCLLRDELAWDILQYAIKVIRAKPKWFTKRVIEHAKNYIANSEVTFTEPQDEVEEAIRKLEGKKREVLDAFFSKVISKDDVRFMNAAYDEQIKSLKEKLEALRNLNSLEYDIRDLADDIEAHLQMIAKANPDDDLFCRNPLDKMVVHPNRRVEIKLNLLPPSWAYVLARLEELRRLKAAENEGCHNNSSVSPLFDTVSHNLPAEKPLQRNDFSGRCHNDPSVPMSVRSPLSSSKGME